MPTPERWEEEGWEEEAEEASQRDLFKLRFGWNE